jgi:hypothetical protein
MKTIERIARRGAVQVKWCAGKMGVRCLAAMAVAFLLGNPARSLAQQPVGDLAGQWSSTTVINGVQVSGTTLIKPDGRFACRAVAGGSVVVDLTGYCSYDNGILTSIYDNGLFERDSVVWLDANTVRSTCLQCSDPTAVGLQIVCKRLR